METTENLKQIIAHHKEIIAELEAEQQTLEKNDLVKENAGLRADYERLRAEHKQLGERAASLADENAGLKNSLYEQIYSEKVKIINATTQKLDVYFRSNIEGELNRLTFLEKAAKWRIDNMRDKLIQNHIDTEDEIYKRLDELSDLLNVKLTEVRAGVDMGIGARTSAGVDAGLGARVGAGANAGVEAGAGAETNGSAGGAHFSGGAFTQGELDELDDLLNEPVSVEQIREINKKNNFERFVGLNVLNAIGIFLVIIGAITLARFTYTHLTDTLKGVMLFALGAVMLGAGEIMNRKKPNIFSLGISAGGIGVLYAALATSYFGLHILDMYPAIILCVLITAGAFTLSNRYNSQTIAIFALIGGYLPMFSISANNNIIYGAMVYFIALNLLALLTAFKKKWRISSFIGLILNISGTIYIISNFGSTNKTFEKLLAILYVFFAFLVYTAIPIVSTYRAKARFRTSDVIMLAINTVFSSLIIYASFYSFDWEGYNGLLSAVFAAVYILLGQFIDRKFTDAERGGSSGGRTRALFYLTGLAFVVLIIPMQFGRAWLSLGWLAEGVLITVYGIIANDKKIKRPGFIICLLCLIAFVTIDITFMNNAMFVYKYLAITLGSLAILGAYMHKKMMSGQFVKLYKIFSLANLWIFAMYMILNKLNYALFTLNMENRSYEIFSIEYLIAALAVTVTFALAYAYLRIKLLADLVTKIMAITLYIIGILALFFNNLLDTPVAPEYLRANSPSLGITAVGTLILFIIGGLSVFAMHDLLKTIMVRRKLSAGWYALFVSGYFVIILTQNLITQYKLSFSSVALSVIYVLTALAWTVFGFARRYPFIRKFGLGLAILSVIKLFLVDLASLTQGYQIISYFALGIALIAISFVYQFFNKRLEAREGVINNEKKDS